MCLGKKAGYVALLTPVVLYLIFTLRLAYVFFVEKKIEAISVLGLFSIPSSLIVKFFEDRVVGTHQALGVGAQFLYIWVFGLIQYALLGFLIKHSVIRFSKN